MILCMCACKQGICVDGLWCSRRLFFKIILSTQNSSDIDLVNDIKSANKVTTCICYLKLSLYFIFYQQENLPD